VCVAARHCLCAGGGYGYCCTLHYCNGASSGRAVVVVVHIAALRAGGGVNLYRGLFSSLPFSGVVRAIIIQRSRINTTHPLQRIRFFRIFLLLVLP
jgi:hypothetical protein